MKKLTVCMLLVALALSTLMVGCGDDAASSSAASTESVASSTASTESTASEDASAESAASEDASAESAASEDASTESAASEDASADDVKVMTYEEYAAAAVDSEVVIEAYVQAKQSWWDNKAIIYTQDENGGAYFVYQMPCTEDEFNALTIGTKIRVKGFKAEWSGEVEIVDATYEVLEGNYVAEATDVTAILGNEAELIKKQNVFAAFKGLTVVAKKDANGAEVAYLYKWDGSGQDGDDLYFDVTDGTNTYSFTVESYLCDNTTDVYAAVKNLKIGDKIDMEGFLYWYNGVNPHITKVTVVAE